jgi:hypothetical protein
LGFLFMKHNATLNWSKKCYFSFHSLTKLHNMLWLPPCMRAYIHTHIHTCKQKQTDRQTDRHTHTHTNKQTKHIQDLMFSQS